MSRDYTLRITFVGEQLVVEGTWYPFRAGAGPMAWSGPTPDEPECFEISSIRMADPTTGKPIGPDLSGLLEPLRYQKEEVLWHIEEQCLKEIWDRQAGEAEARYD